MELEFNEKQQKGKVKIIDTPKFKTIDLSDIDSDDDDMITEPDETITLLDGFEYTKNDLTEDGVLTIDAQFRHLDYLDKKREREKNELDKDKEYRKQMTRRVILLSLYDLGLNPLTNTYQLKNNMRDKLQKQMRTYEDIAPEEIIKKFNEVCATEIFDNPDYDISKMPIYDI